MRRKIIINKVMLTIFIFMVSFFLFGCNDNNNNETKEVFIVFDTSDLNVTVQTLKGKPGETVVAPEDPLRDGYKFSHWTLDGEKYTFSVFPDKTIILHAVWNESYKISFNTGLNGVILDNDYYFEGETIGEMPIAPNKVSNSKIYIFKNWLLDGEPFTLTKMPKQNIELEAQYEETQGIIFDVEGDYNQIIPIALESGKKIVAPKEEPYKENHIFVGWLLNNQPFMFNIAMPSGSNITLKAKFISEDLEYNSRTELPKLMINLENGLSIGSVVREYYVNSQISILNTDGTNLYSAPAEFKGRGNGSWTDSGSKKGYRIKFNEKQSVLGEAKSKHWVILACTNFNDKTLSKNKMAFDMANEVFTNLEYATSANYVEVYVNGSYYGVYILAEHMRVDKNRVNIESNFVTENPESTGYFIEYDAYATGTEGIDYFTMPAHASFHADTVRKFTIKSPDPEDYLAEGLTEAQYRAQVSYIRDFTIKALTPMLDQNYAEFAKWCDVDSFVDMYILHELFKNTDTGFSSFFLYKKAGIDKLYAGPPWDFDASAGANRGDQTSQGIFVAGTVESSSRHTANMFFIRMYKNAEFKAKVVARWKAISSDVKSFVSNALTDEFLETNKLAMGRNFKYWSRDASYGNPNNQTSAENAWVSATKTLRSWLLNRATWLDYEWI